MIKLDSDESVYLKSKIDNMIHIVTGLIDGCENRDVSEKNHFVTSKEMMIDLSFDTIEGQFEIKNLHMLNTYWGVYLGKYQELSG